MFVKLFNTKFVIIRKFNLRIIKYYTDLAERGEFVI